MPATLVNTAHPLPLEANCLPSLLPDTQIAATAINMQSTMEATRHCKRWKTNLKVVLKLPLKLFLESAPRPIQSLSRDVGMFVVCRSPLLATQTGWTGNFWSKAKIAKLRNLFFRFGRKNVLEFVSCFWVGCWANQPTVHSGRVLYKLL